MAQQPTVLDPPPSGSVPTARYRVEVLQEAEADPAGIAHQVGEERRLLPWSRVERALAAEVGEPEGVRTVVFDLVVERKQDGCLVARFDADPYDEAREVALRLCSELPAAAISTSLHEVATDGISTRRYPDLDALAEGSLADLGFTADPLFSC